MTAESFSPRSNCLRCRRALSACWCEQSFPQQTRAELVVLQHPREARNPIGTARMAHLGVEGSALRVGIHFAEDPIILAELGDKTRRNIVLYPGPNSRPAEELRGVEEPLRIFMLDGTWWQAKKLWQANPWLHALPTYRLTPQVAGQYRIRKEPAAHCLATIEAVAQLLDVIGDKEGEHAPLLRPFHVMVEKQIAHAQAPQRSPRIRTRRGAGRRCPQLQELVSLLPRLVLVHAEGNGWPKHPSRLSPDSGPDVEIMQWLAIRPLTGEKFHALLQTETRAPSVLRNQALTEVEMQSAISKKELLLRWQEFARDDDVWCTWGHSPTSLMRQAGGVTPMTINLQKICNTWFRRRMQHVENALEALGNPDVIAEFPGRGGRRIVQMAATVHALAGE